METLLLRLFTEVCPQDYLVTVLDGVSYHITLLGTHGASHLRQLLLRRFIQLKASNS